MFWKAGNIFFFHLPAFTQLSDHLLCERANRFFRFQNSIDFNEQSVTILRLLLT